MVADGWIVEIEGDDGDERRRLLSLGTAGTPCGDRGVAALRIACANGTFAQASAVRTFGMTRMHPLLRVALLTWPGEFRRHYADF